MKNRKKILETTMKRLQRKNPNRKFRVIFCKSANEFVIQVYNERAGWNMLWFLREGGKNDL